MVTAFMPRNVTDLTVESNGYHMATTRPKPSSSSVSGAGRPTRTPPSAGKRPSSPPLLRPSGELPGGAIATLGKDWIMISADDGVTWKTVAAGLPIPKGDHVVGGLAYNAVAGAAYAWFWD